MCEISVVMAAYNAEKYIGEAIESVLRQSFSDYEFIIVDDGSTDNTSSVIRSFKDKRIQSFKNRHDYIGSLNVGMDSAKGKYIACVDADDIMHSDRLKIQYAVMEEEPEITVCGSWMSPFGDNIPKGTVSQTVSGIVEHPLLMFLKGNFVFHPTAMIRSDFMRKNSLKYENYECAGDYKVWIEITKKGGNFYIEPQPLLYKRIYERQINDRKKEIQQNTLVQIKEEIMDYLMDLNKKDYPSLKKIADAMSQVKKEGLMDDNDIVSFFYAICFKNKYRLTIDCT